MLANLGDCRAVLCGAGGGARALTRDHVASDPAEAARVRAAGGALWPDAEGRARVDGVIEVRS